MTRLVDLIRGQEELCYCSALGIILQFEEESRPILRALLNRIADAALEERGKALRTLGTALASGEQIEDIEIGVEEPVPGSVPGRFDLTLRFALASTRYLIIVEAKVAAMFAHGAQLATYEAGMKDLRAQGAADVILFGLLTMRGHESLRGETRGFAMADFAVRWDDVGTALASAKRGEVQCAIVEDFRESIEEWNMPLSKYAEVLRDSPMAFPIQIDALETMARRLKAACGADKLIRDPAAWNGPVWTDADRGSPDDGRYYCGYWWRTKKDLPVGVYLEWPYRRRGDGLVMRGPTGDGYGADFALWLGGSNEQTGRLPVERFHEVLDDERVAELAVWLNEGPGDNCPLPVAW